MKIHHVNSEEEIEYVDQAVMNEFFYTKKMYPVEPFLVATISM